MMQALVVFAGGGAGSLLRFYIGEACRHNALNLPVATLLSNLLACAIFALVVMAAGRTQVSPQTQLLLLTGFCGGLSTFSTFGYETFLLLRQGMVWWAVINVALSTLLALVMFRLIVK